MPLLALRAGCWMEKQNCFSSNSDVSSDERFFMGYFLFGRKVQREHLPCSNLLRSKDGHRGGDEQQDTALTMTPGVEEHSCPSSTPATVPPPPHSLLMAGAQSPQPHASLQLHKPFSYFKIMNTSGYGDDWMFPFVSHRLAEEGSPKAKHSVDSLHQQSLFVLEHPPQPSLS